MTEMLLNIYMCQYIFPLEMVSLKTFYKYNTKVF